MSGSRQLFYGPVISPQTLTSYDAFPRCLLAVGETGNIEWIVEDVAQDALEELVRQKGWAGADFVQLRDGEFLLPGFVDTHTVRSSLLSDLMFSYPQEFI